MFLAKITCFASRLAAYMREDYLVYFEGTTEMEPVSET